MSYTTTLRLYQTNPNAYFRPVEQTVWNYANGGTWSHIDEERKLAMGGSGTSGTIRFVADTGDNFLVAVGVHNYKRWCDIVPDLTSTQTGAVIQPLYYTGPRNSQREQQSAACTATNSKGRKFNVVYTVGDGNDLKANIVIG
ncbi:hypothetical protein GALMADRAFT_65329 [Galerina marginata CBS 339.88]|uniref:Lectin n=1 Tax=Galerina marginata (strain CBS 339.88) TaxID=685588 RepID=A0A067T540_GALM3|nr:hypothetical protein GALMADRAFT_65329 [Galerina marginata CBS 339.88]